MTRPKSRSDAPKTGKLAVTAPDAGTEIFVVNSRFERVGSGVGTLTKDLDPGIYKVRFRAGTAMRDVLTEVRVGECRTLQESGPLVFDAAAPLSSTATTHEFQQEPAARISRVVHTRAGVGSRLMLFARDAAESGAGIGAATVSVCDADGQRVGDVTQGEVDERARFAGWTVEVSPGAYRVRVETAAKGSYDIFVTAVPGWQTQVFLAVEDFPFEGEIIRRPALRSASVMMSPVGSGFDPSDQGQRMAERARAALQYGRGAVGASAINSLLSEKIANPMLGILGLHLALLEPEPDLALFATALANLEPIVGSHPDVLAARLDPRLPANLRPRRAAFPTPPLLRRSWDLIAEATATRPGLVPPGSVSDWAADEQVPGGPWLLVRVRRTGAADRPVDGAEAAARFRTLCAAAGDRARRARMEEWSRERGGLTSLQRGVLEAALSCSWTGGEDSSAHGSSRAPSVRDLIAATKSPACAVARAATFLFRELPTPRTAARSMED